MNIVVSQPRPIHRRTTFSIVSASNDTIAEATLTPRDGVLFLTNVWTQHEHRGQGLATRVITEALAHAGPQEVWLYVWGYSGQPLPDDALVTFYQKFGFERVPGVPIMMKRPAPPAPAAAVPQVIASSSLDATAANYQVRSVLFDVEAERLRQDQKWGEQNHAPMEWLSILGEEVGEVCQAANEAHWHQAPLAHYREELIQVAAVAVAAVEALDRHLARKAAANE